jgi:integrase
MSKTNKEKNEQKLEKFMSENKTRKITSRKGTITTSNHIDYDKALNKALSMLGTKNENFGFYIIVAINTGLRIGDILNIKKRHFEKDALTFREQKTSKAKTVPFNKHIKDYFLQLKPLLSLTRVQLTQGSKSTER